MAEGPTLRLSIIIAAYGSGHTIARCLESLLPQCKERAEIIVVDSGDDGTAELVAKRYPEVELVHFDHRLYPGAARNRGIERAGGEILGFIDADCVATSDWIAQILWAHESARHSAIGGAIGAADARSACDWAAYFCSFYNWMPGTREGEVEDIPTCCLSVRRSTFDRFGPFRENGFSSDTEFNWALARAGHRLLFDPRICVLHIHHPGWGRFVRRQLERGRAFSHMRIAAGGFSTPRRLVYLAGSPLIPVKFMVRLLRLLRRSGTPPEYRRAIARSWPAVLLGFIVWSLGEAIGYGGGSTTSEVSSRA